MENQVTKYVNRGIKVNAGHCTANSKQIFPEMKLHSLVPNFHIHVSVSNLYITGIGLPILLLILQQETHVAVLGGLR
jgi:hypothetical protein